jgi:hypothetical protein
MHIKSLVISVTAAVLAATCVYAAPFPAAQAGQPIPATTASTTGWVLFVDYVSTTDPSDTIATTQVGRFKSKADCTKAAQEITNDMPVKFAACFEVE